MNAFLKITVCALAIVAICSASVNGEIMVKNYYRLGEADFSFGPPPAIGDPGLDPTVDSNGYLNLGKFGSPTYAAGATNPGSTLSMEFYGIGTDTPATHYYNTTGVGSLFTTNNFGLDFWVNIKSFPEYNNQAFVSIGEYGSYNGGTNWGLHIGSTSNDNGNFIVAAANGYFWTGSTPLSTNQWYHVVFVSKTPLGTGEHDHDSHLYINGVEEIGGGSMPMLYDNAGTQINNSVTIGARNAQPHRFDWGASALIDEYRLFTFAEGQFDIRDTEIIPEPGTLALLVMGLLGMVVYAWRKRR
ncbi:MAG: PEP-CTERM sorting domain-containing protein [Pirellulaceae bacterium]|nr:PEP-CTERM sorting domain-containing protein [Pirellulaceae bacterium]